MNQLQKDNENLKDPMDIPDLEEKKLDVKKDLDQSNKDLEENQKVKLRGIRKKLLKR